MDLTTIIIGAGIFVGAGVASYASNRAARNGEYKMLMRIESQIGSVAGKVDRLDGRMDAFASRLDHVEERINADS